MPLQPDIAATADRTTVVVRVVEGLGNQLFQYAMGLGLATQYGADLYLDTRFYTQARTNRTFLLHDLLDVKASVLASTAEVDAVLAGDGSARGKEPWLLRPADLGYHPIELDAGERYYCWGWWQNYGYVQPVEELIVAQISRTTPFVPPTEAIGIHVRGGDYRTGPMYNVVTRDYYASAIEKARALATRPEFFVFTDDREYAEWLLPADLRACFMATDNSLDDLLNLAKCTHQVIPNSTFGWWAGVLNRNRGKRVFMPDRWYNRVDVGNPPYMAIDLTTPDTVPVPV